MRTCAGAALVAALFLSLPSAAKDVSFELDLVRGVAPIKQRYLRVAKDDEVSVRVLSDVAGEIHLHGYKLEAKVAPGKPAHLKFKAFATGRYRFDWHPAGEADAKAGHAHGAAPATLEVRPR